MAKTNANAPMDSIASINERIRKLELTKAYVLGGTSVGVLLILGYFGFSSFYQIPHTVRSLLPQAVNEYVEKKHPNYEKDLRKYRKSAHDASIKAGQSAKLAADKSAAVNVLLDELKSHPALLRIASGEARITASSHPDIRRTNYCTAGPENNRGSMNQRIEFETRFRQVPKVMVSLAALDHVIDSGVINNLRISVAVVSVDREGFNYNMNTWCNTDLYSARMSWIAYGN